MGKRSPAPPPAPDYAALARQQGQENIEAAKTSSILSNPNIYTPYGSQTVTYEANAQGFLQPTVRQEVSPTTQQAIREQEEAQRLLSLAAVNAAYDFTQSERGKSFRPENIPALRYGLEQGLPNIPGVHTVEGVIPQRPEYERPGYDLTGGIANAPGAEGYAPQIRPYGVEALPGQLAAETTAARGPDPAQLTMLNTQGVGEAGGGVAAPALQGFQYSGPGVTQMPFEREYGLAQGGPSAPTLQGPSMGGVGTVGQGVGVGQYGMAAGGPAGGLYGMAAGGPGGVQFQGLDLTGLGGPQAAPAQGQFGYAQQYVQGPELQRQIDIEGLAAAPVQAGTTAQQAIMSRLAPQLQGERQALYTQLINQGLRPGGEAFNAAMSAQAQKENDLMLQAAAQGIALDQAARQQGFAEQQARAMFANQAQLQGFGAGMEQAGLYNVGLGQNVQQALATQAAQNQAQQQAFQQRVQAGEFGREAQLASFQTGQQAQESVNRAIAQNFAQAQAAQQMQNQAIQQNLQGALAAEEAQRAAQAQRFGQAVTGAELGAQLTGQQFAMGQSAQEAQNQAIAQNFQQAIAAREAQNAAQQQQFQQALAQTGFGRETALAQFQAQQQAQQLANAAQQQNFAQRLAGGEYNREALLQQFGMGQQAQQLANAAAAQNFAQQQAAQEFNLARQQQGYGQAMGQAELFNQAQAQAYQRALAQQAAQNAVQQQRFGQGMDITAARNAALAQQQAMDYQRLAAANASQQQQFQQNIAAQQFYNTAAQQALAQQAAIRSIPVNEISALLSGGQVNVPQFQGYSGVTVAPAPIFQAGQAQDAAAMQRYGIQANQAASNLGGLFGLAGAIAGAPSGGFLAGLIK